MATSRKTTKKPTTTKKKTTPIKRKTPIKKKNLSPLVYEIIGLAIIALAIVSLFKLGIVGDSLQAIMKFLFGNWYVVIPFFMIGYAAYMMVIRALPEFKNRFVWGFMTLLSSATLFSQITLFKEVMSGDKSVILQTWRILVTERGVLAVDTSLGGGMIGGILFAFCHVLFDTTGAFIMAWLLGIVALILITGRALVPYIMQQWPVWKESIASRRKEVREARKYRRAVKKQLKEQRTEKIPTDTFEHLIVDEQIQPIKREQEKIEDVKKEEVKKEPKISAFTQRIEDEMLEEPTEEQLEEEEIIEHVVISEEENLENKQYKLPQMTLLKMPKPTDQSGEFSIIQENAMKLEQTFQSFGVKATVTEVHLGPAVTEYEVLPDRGVKVSKIVNLQDDLALALAAKDIRIEAPIPGKSAVGIEVPNKEVAMVGLREVLEAKENNQPDAKLLIGLGRDISGEAKLAQLNKMPHLLVAGSTGSGKSVCINGIIVSILMRAKPHEVKLMMIDPKMVELNVYNGIPHLLAPVVTDARKASQALKKVVSEMERRYDLFSHTGTRNIEGYNNHVDRFNIENNEKHPHLPFIVVIVDELADLMMVASNDVEDSITRLAQMARAAGIHLIIATQRPSVDVITGVIKANIPSRIAFAVSSAIDSRTILDMGGAERLLGRGDMLFLPAGESKPVRVQGAFVSDEEVEEVVNYVIGQQKAQYQEEMIPSEEEESVDGEEVDELYLQAVDLVIEQETASVSFLQRKLKVGYARAARIMDQMEERGIVGPAEKSKPRQVLQNRY